jgi:hypothetical protein
MLDLLDELDELDAMAKTMVRSARVKGGNRKSKASDAALKSRSIVSKGHALGQTGKKIRRFHAQGSLRVLTKVTGLAKGELEVVTYSSQSPESVLGKTLAHKIQSHALKISRQLERKGYVLAMVPVQATATEEVVGVIDDEEPGTDAQVDPYEAGRQAIDALKEAEGGHVDRTKAAELLDIGLAQLYNRLDQKKVVAWVDAAGRYHFPKWQFGVNGLLHGVSECLQILGKADEWAVMRFFLTPSTAAGDVSPLQLLRAGRIEEAKQIASQQSVHG